MATRWYERLMEWMTRMDELDERQAEARAVGFVTVSTDLQIGSIFIVGVYETRAEAERAALDQQAQMDEIRDEVSPGWHVRAYRVMPKEDS